jgi:alkylation response protein AidB-like acyl-CoA dehydrogenase
MNVEFTDDQNAFRDVVRRFLAAKSPPTVVRKLMASSQGYDEEVWKQLCSEVGLAGTHIPEQYGGFGFGPVELGIVAEEMGKHLYCGPFFSSAVMAGYAVLNGATEAQKEKLLPSIADGSVIATLVLDEISIPERVGKSLVASRTGDRFTLSGTAAIVLDAQVADLFIVVARVENELGLFAADGVATGVSINPLEALDPTRKLFRVCLDSTPAEKIGELTPVALSLLWDQLSMVLAHEMIGGAQVLFDSTIDYMKIRVQFGRPIASFQALKHRCADLLMELELAKATTHYAAHCLATGEGDPWACSMAKAMAGDAYMTAAREAIQLRGGIGFTWENDTHLWFKRAKASEVFLGSPHQHRERMISIMEDAADA